MELHEYATLNPNESSECNASVYTVPQKVMEDKPSLPDTIGKDTGNKQSQLSALHAKEKSNKNTILGTCLIMLFAVHIAILCFLVLIYINIQQDFSTQAKYTTETQLQTLMQMSTKAESEQMKNTTELLTRMETELSLFKTALNQINATIFNIQSTLRSVKETTKIILPLVQNVANQMNTTVPTVDQMNEKVQKIIRSCQELKTLIPSSTSGYYYLNNEVVYCEMGELCGVDGGWSRLAYLDMTDNTITCPSGLRYYYSSAGSVRACGRPSSNSGSCGSVTFPSHGIRYSEVCGRVVGYQYGSPDGLHGPANINSYYVDGVSITSGNPRTHVWTLIGEVYQTQAICPCRSQYSGPSFIGNDYFCESGNPTTSWEPITFYTADPLWDGEGCSSDETGCCSGPPWFHKTIPTTTDYLEMRICGNEKTNNEDTPVSAYEIYVK